MASTASFAAAVLIRNGSHIISCNSSSFPFHSARTITRYFSCSFYSFQDKGNRKGHEGRPLVALVPSSSLVSPLLRSTRRRFCRAASIDAETSSSPSVAGTSTSTEDVTFASSSPSPADTDSAASSSSSEEDSLRNSADALDIRVGQILKAWRHPEADSLYIEEVDLGESEPRTICSGLVNYVPLDELQDAKVIVLANLKPRNMCGVKSNGMLLAASDASHENVELLQAPEGAAAGERIWFGSEDEQNNSAPASPNQVQKKKIWESVKPHMKTNGDCVAVLGVHPMRTSAGVVVCKSLRDGNVS